MKQKQPKIDYSFLSGTDIPKHVPLILRKGLLYPKKINVLKPPKNWVGVSVKAAKKGHLCQFRVFGWGKCKDSYLLKEGISKI